MRLFTASVHDLFKQAEIGAVRDVGNLSDEELEGPRLGHLLDNIASQNLFNVAALRPDERTGTRRQETRMRNDYGQQISAEVTVIDVRIPFAGDPISFQVAPSSSHIIDRAAEVGSRALTVAFLDADNLDQKVDEFIRLVSENLDRLRREVEQRRPHLRKLAEQVAQDRLGEIRTQRERDKKRSFPIS